MTKAARATPATLSLALLSALTLAACKPAGPVGSPGPGAVLGPVDRTRPLPDPLPAIAARVNSEPILTARAAGLARSREDRGTTKDGPNPAALRESLQQLIARELLFQEAVRRGLTPDARSLERAYDSMRAAETEEARWLKRLAAEGLSKDELRQELRVQATVAELLRTLGGRQPADVGDDEARAFLGAHPALARIPERDHLRQILVRVAPEASEAQRAARQTRAAELRERLLKGADFAALARAESDDEATRDLGGDLGVLGPGSLRATFAQVVRELKPGEFTELLVSSDGFHILKLEDRLPAEELGFADVAARVREAVVEEQQRARRDALLRELEAHARIEVFL